MISVGLKMNSLQTAINTDTSFQLWHGLSQDIFHV